MCSHVCDVSFSLIGKQKLIHYGKIEVSRAQLFGKTHFCRQVQQKLAAKSRLTAKFNFVVSLEAAYSKIGLCCEPGGRLTA
jgi:hypothetical protein